MSFPLFNPLSPKQNSNYSDVRVQLQEIIDYVIHVHPSKCQHGYRSDIVDSETTTTRASRLLLLQLHSNILTGD